MNDGWVWLVMVGMTNINMIYYTPSISGVGNAGDLLRRRAAFPLASRKLLEKVSYDLFFGHCSVV